jgi:predicted acylesterase/phospholipase RssA
MKKLAIPLILILVIVIYSILASLKKDDTKGEIFQKRSGTAIIMTGAAARIPQEAALLEELYNRGLMNNVVFISGVSSGALNSVALNGILSGKMTWDEYKKILFGIRNNDIFIQEGKKLPVNTDPERQLLINVAEKRLGFHTIGDLPFMTEISITNLKDLDMKAKVYRMCSRKINDDTDLSLSIVDILMASTSFPVAFPPVRIKNVKTIPDVEYVDGGVGDDHIPYHALLEFEKYRGEGVERIYIISRKSDSIPAISEELSALGINDRKIFDDLGVSFDNIMKKGFIKRLKDFSREAPELIPLTYIWVPDFKKDFLMFNFDKLQEQYDLTTSWAKTHEPILLEKYLIPYYNEKKKEYE